MCSINRHKCIYSEAQINENRGGKKSAELPVGGHMSHKSSNKSCRLIFLESFDKHDVLVFSLKQFFLHRNGSWKQNIIFKVDVLNGIRSLSISSNFERVTLWLTQAPSGGV